MFSTIEHDATTGTELLKMKQSAASTIELISSGSETNSAIDGDKIESGDSANEGMLGTSQFVQQKERGGGKLSLLQNSQLLWTA